MKRKISYIPVFLLILCMVAACGKKEDEYVSANYSSGSNMSDEDREQQYMEYLADEVKQAFSSHDGINDIDIEITSYTDVWNVNVKVDYSDSQLDTTEMNQSIEEALTKFFPEGTKLSVAVR